jgi:hypothetical protein
MMAELIRLQDTINDVIRLNDEAWEVVSMMEIAASHADIDTATAAGAVARILELAQARGRVAAAVAAGLKRRAIKSKR